ncbi:MAG: YezD family protein [Terrimicrobiaceae bacterium]|nr:YezD family protein [Terrimicrobiaceae bacterium]
MDVNSKEASTTRPTDDSRWLATVEQQVRALKFGSILITVHEGRVVQIETSVKVRFDRNSG